mmetsp:Transcript_131294/g.331581  ORF Transcript_131294/g.331581 Transcript_131294/m.331581 type:complete len:104 (+) Transcript_131294:1668-1979(+)
MTCAGPASWIYSAPWIRPTTMPRAALSGGPPVPALATSRLRPPDHVRRGYKPPSALASAVLAPAAALAAAAAAAAATEAFVQADVGDAGALTWMAAAARNGKF